MSCQSQRMLNGLRCVEKNGLISPPDLTANDITESYKTLFPRGDFPPFYCTRVLSSFAAQACGATRFMITSSFIPFLSISPRIYIYER